MDPSSEESEEVGIRDLVHEDLFFFRCDVKASSFSDS